jgi:hypothetical protein
MRLSGLLEDVFFSTRLRVSFQYNGAPPHQNDEALQWLSKDILDAVLAGNMKLQFPDLYVHLTLFLSI